MNNPNVYVVTQANQQVGHVGNKLCEGAQSDESGMGRRVFSGADKEQMGALPR